MIINGIDILESVCSLLICRKKLTFVCLFCVLWPCWTHVLVLSRLFCRVHWILYLENYVIFKWEVLFLPFWSVFISFSCLTVLDWTCSTVLNKNGKSRYLYIFLSLMGKAFSLIPLSMMLTRFFFCRCSFLSSGRPPLFLVFYEIFITNGCWIFSSFFPPISWYNRDFSTLPC